jgi:quercetin dioxygenase-like cupin family protein
VNNVPKGPPAGGTAFFLGGTVTGQPLLNQEHGKYYRVHQVNFGKGSRNVFHAHSTDQLLVITGGNGIMATEKEQIEVGVGDIVLFSASEKHWHGATKDSDMSHLAITPLDDKVIKLEP